MPSWAIAKPARARARVAAIRAATALPNAIPSRKPASIVANACRLPPRRWESSRVQSTSYANDTAPESAIAGRIHAAPVPTARSPSPGSAAAGVLRASSAARPKTAPFAAAPIHTERRSPSSGISQNAAQIAPAIAPAVLTA
jgi:hypothetical protein